MFKKCLAAALVAASFGVAAPAANAQSSYINEDTGADCVTLARTYNEPTYGGGTRYYVVYRNTCGRGFNVTADRLVVDPSTMWRVSGSYIGPGSNQSPSELSLSCSYESNNLAQSCTGFTGAVTIR